MHAVGSTAVPFTCARKEPQMRFSSPFQLVAGAMDDPGTQNGDNAQMASRTAQKNGEDPDGGGDL